MNNKILIAISIALVGCCLFAIYKALDYRRHTNFFLEKYTNVATEFSGRQRYAEDNLRLIDEKPQGSRIVFLGDQIIEAWDLSKYFWGYDAINRGISGQRLSGYLLRLRPDALDLKPRAVLIQFSSYNFRPWESVRTLQDYVCDLTDLARANGVEPILTTVIPVKRDLNFYRSEDFKPYPVADSVAQFNLWLSDFCRAHDYRVIDFNKALSDNTGYLREECSIDNTHLTASGYKRLTDVTRQALARLR